MVKHFDSFSWNVLLMTMALFVCCQYQTKVTETKILSKLAGTTLIVYMLHSFLLEKLNRIGIHVARENEWWTVPVMTIGIYLVCTLIALVIVSAMQKAKKVFEKI